MNEVNLFNAMPPPRIRVRPASSISDADELLRLITRLAEFEELAPPDDEARGRFQRDGFERKPPRFHAMLASVDNEPACGYVIYFETYSTFLCRPTLYLEDLFVLPESRKHGVGKALMQRVVREAVDRGCGRMEWTCLDWNTNAMEFYKRMGADHLEQWYFYRLDQVAMTKFDESDAMK